MSSTETATSLSFRPWQTGKKEETALKDVLARVNLERGHFRDITEASLQEEMAAEGALELSSSDEDDEGPEEEGAPGQKRKAATTREELYAAKREMDQHVAAAHEDIMTALDFIALLESKYAQSQAMVSVSPNLRKTAPLGSLAGDVWDSKSTPADAARQAQDNLLASKVRMTSLQRSADDLLAASTRLQENVRKETVFWDQILGISEKGWSVSRIPGSHLLGVHFGFNGCATEFARRDIAALIEESEGTIALERGIGTKPKAVRAVVRKDGRIVGRSKLPPLPDEADATLDARIRHARDSVFDEELFHELIRESRTLTSLGVLMKGSIVSFDAGHDSAYRIELELVSLDRNNSLPMDSSHDFDHLAQAALLAARLFLGQKHRETMNRQREIPPPMSETKSKSQQSFSILRPLVILMKHHGEVYQLNNYLQDMSSLLRLTGVTAECETAQMGIALPLDGSGSIESLIGAISRPVISVGELFITPSDDTPLVVKLQIESSPSIGLGSTFSLVQAGGDLVRLEDIKDLFIATDETLALMLATVLAQLVGDGWILDPREGILHRTDGEEPTNSMSFTVNAHDKTVALHAARQNERKKQSWRLGSEEERRNLKDVWKSLVE